MKYTIRKRFTFAASHQLTELPAGHPCARLHGHTYTVWLELASDDLTTPGFVMDFGDLAPFKDHIDTTLDHRHLNDILTRQPTSEHLAHHLYKAAHQHWPDNVQAIVVQESESTYAEFRP